MDFNYLDNLANADNDYFYTDSVNLCSVNVDNTFSLFE